MLQLRLLLPLLLLLLLLLPPAGCWCCCRCPSTLSCPATQCTWAMPASTLMLLMVLQLALSYTPPFCFAVRVGYPCFGTPRRVNGKIVGYPAWGRYRVHNL